MYPCPLLKITGIEAIGPRFADFDMAQALWKNSDGQSAPARTLSRPSRPFAAALSAAALLLLSSSPLPAATSTFSLGGLLSAQSTARFDALVRARSSPSASSPRPQFSLSLGRGVTLDAEASANAYGSPQLPLDAHAATSGDIKPYRGWLRLSTSRFEARVGLQKINFGSATLFRPMMWFDSHRPPRPAPAHRRRLRPPPALLHHAATPTSGPGRCTATTTPRGCDLAPPDKKTPEFGGRAQVPLFKGEIAATYHHRKAAIDGLVPVMTRPRRSPSRPSPRTGSASTASGTSASASGSRAPSSTSGRRSSPCPTSAPSTLGLDYTFGLGNGLTSWPSTSGSSRAPGPSPAATALSFSGLLLRYPLGLLDDLDGIFYYDWKNRTSTASSAGSGPLTRSRSTPCSSGTRRSSASSRASRAPSSFAGKGFQLLLGYLFLGPTSRPP